MGDRMGFRNRVSS